MWNYTILNFHFMCWNYKEMFYWCNLSPPSNILIMAVGHRWTCTDCGRKGNKNKEVGSNLWRWSSLSPLFATGDVSSEAKANFIKTWGMGCVRLRVEPALYYYRLYLCFREKYGGDQYIVLQAHIPNSIPDSVKSNRAFMLHPVKSQELGASLVQGVCVGSNRSESLCFI